MMRYATVLLLLAFAGCKDCQNVACGAAAPPVHLRVVDAVTNDAINASFFENGQPVSAQCTLDDAGAACAQYDLFLFGEHTVTVQATSYQPQTIHFDTGIIGDCCKGAAHDVNMTVALNH